MVRHVYESSGLQIRRDRAKTTVFERASEKKPYNSLRFHCVMDREQYDIVLYFNWFLTDF